MYSPSGMPFIVIFKKLTILKVPNKETYKTERKKEKKKHINHLSCYHPKIANGNILFGLLVFSFISIPHLFLGSLLFSFCILRLGVIVQTCPQLTLHRADWVHLLKLSSLKPPMPSSWTLHKFQSPYAVLAESLQVASLTLYSQGFLFSSLLLVFYCWTN